MLERGTRFGRYEVLRHAGAGGMGDVYAAYDPELERNVALKLLRPGTAGARAAELKREAQALARLAHANVVAVHDVGTSDGQVYVAMELVEGPTLRAWLAEKPRTAVEILAVFDAAGQGLSAAHGAGLVHRDFKPENVLLGADGRARVTDFGLAVAAGAAGELAGSVPYMAPEQLQGEAVDARADQFAFAVALYEALYGERPFAGSTGGDVTPTEALLLEVLEGRVRPAPPRAR